MSLKQSIVIVNRFTVKSKSGVGSRGSTPGTYVSQYMGREDAIERIPPVRVYDTDTYIRRYMARRSATEQLDLDIPEVSSKINSVDKAGGVAFGYGSVSLSDERFKAASRDIQAQFDKGKTVMATVVSFTDDYLKEMGVVSPDFVLTHKGGYKGNVDQLKLRMAIMSGVDQMARNYDDLQYVGCIQVDTQHVHCHLAMVDKGKGNLAPNGTQKGKLSKAAMNQMRRGIDNFLDGYGKMRTMSSSLNYDKRNTLCYIKKFTHKALEQQGFSQVLMASLPENKKLWRAGCKAKSMQKSNAILRNYVTHVLEQLDSGYDEAMASIKQYASKRRRREGLSRAEYRKLCANGKEALISDCMNSVYGVLKRVPESEKVPAPKIMASMSAGLDDLVIKREDAKVIQDAKSLSFLDFGVKMRNYKSRLDVHKRDSNKFRDTGAALKAQENISEPAKAVLHFVDFEAEYQARCACKYQHFLKFIQTDEEDDEVAFKELLAYKEKMDNLERMRQDKNMGLMRPKAAEAYGEKVYDMHGGRFMVIAPYVLEMRQVMMQERFDKMRDAFGHKLFESGRSLQVDSNTGSMKVVNEPVYNFDDVKALDLHHMSYDFSHRIPVSDKYVKQFVQTAEIRSELYERAKEYLVKTNQQQFLSLFPEQDIMLMRDVADSLKLARNIQTKTSVTMIPVDERSGGKVNEGAADKPVPKTLPLGKSCRKCQYDLDLAIRTTVQSTAAFNELD